MKCAISAFIGRLDNLSPTLTPPAVGIETSIDHFLSIKLHIFLLINLLVVIKQILPRG